MNIRPLRFALIIFALRGVAYPGAAQDHARIHKPSHIEPNKTWSTIDVSLVRPIRSDEFSQYVEILQLTEDQSGKANKLYQNYLRSVREISEPDLQALVDGAAHVSELRAQQERAASDDLFLELLEGRENYVKRLRNQDEILFQSFSELLTESQQEHFLWVTLKRRKMRAWYAPPDPRCQPGGSRCGSPSAY